MSKNNSSNSVRKQIEEIKRKKIAAEKVVSLRDFRSIKTEGPNKSILVVDDEEVMRNAIKRILEDEGFKVVTAEDGVELSKALETHSFDLILLDINLPWVNGLELCQILKNQHNLNMVPVIMISANKTEEEIKKGFEVGCSDYITKPFDVEIMVEKVNKTLMLRADAE